MGMTREQEIDLAWRQRQISRQRAAEVKRLLLKYRYEQLDQQRQDKP